MKTRVTEYLLYRWRFRIGYFVIATLAGALLYATLFIPGELRSDEIQSVLTSSSLSKESLDPAMVVNFPYHILQRISVNLLGVNTLSIKLPSLILGALTIVGIFALVRAWLKPNVAVITTTVLATTTQFLFMTQDGTPAIMFNAVAVWLLVAGLYVTRGRYFHTFWKILGGVLMAVALYLPLGIYLVLALVLTAIFHPHIRYIMKRLGKTKLSLAGILGLVGLAPLIYAIIINPSIALELAGWPSDLSNTGTNAITTLLNLFGFAATSTSALLRPAYSLTLIIIALLGIYRLIRTHYTARSYVTIILSVILLPLALLTPSLGSALFFVITIAVVTGFDFIIRYWYQLFPRNPYARLAGLLPLAVLVSGMTVTNILHYVDGYTYTPDVLSHYSRDLSLINSEVAQESSALLSTENERPLYALAAAKSQNLTVLDDSSQATSTQVIVTRAARDNENLPENWSLERIVTNNRANESDRLYIYKISQ